MTVFESKPVCSIHHQSIEQIKHGIAKWSCPKKGCKSKEIGYSNKLISEIWMGFWDDETEIQDDDINSNIEEKINDEDENLDIIDDGLEEKDDFSIEVNDENGHSGEDEK